MKDVLISIAAEGAADVAAAGVGLLGIETGPVDVALTMGTRYVVKKAVTKALGGGNPSPEM